MRKGAVWFWGILAYGVTALGTAFSWKRMQTGNPLFDVPMHTFGSAAVTVGLVMWAWTSLHRIGQLVVVVGVVFHLNDLRAAHSGPLFAAGFCLAYLWVPVVAQVALTWPDGRIDGRFTRALLGYGYVSTVGCQILRFVVDQPQSATGFDQNGPATTASRVGSVAVIVDGLLIAAVMVRRRHGADPVRRRHFAPFWSAVVAGVLITVATGVVAIAGMPATAQFAFAAGGLLIGVCIVPAIYVAQLVRDAEAQNRLFADLERGIGLHTDPVRVQQALAGTLGDPRLRLLSPAEAREPATPGPGRRRTPVRQGDRLLCVIEHDEVLTRQRGARLAMTAAAVLAMERKERLDQLAEANRRLREQIEQVRESRSRVAEAAAAERRRIQQDLHDNAQQRLLTVRARIDMARLQLRAGGDAPATLDRAHAELGDAVAGLRRLIQRIYPLSLTEHGLAAAVEELADGAPLTVHVRIPRLRWSPSLECTAYFVVAEALGNVYKHARAGRVVVAVLDGPGSLTVEVTDDGAGLPATAGPPVLRSLRDRVQAAGGCLTAGPGEPTGTRITAELPKEEPACVS